MTTAAVRYEFLFVKTKRARLNTSMNGLAFWIGLMMLLTPAALYLFAVLSFWMNVSVGILAPSGIVALSLAWLWHLWRNRSRREGQELAVASVVTVVAGLGALAASAALHDFSWDGQHYHQPAVIALAKGWNPLRVPHVDEWSPSFADTISSDVYVSHYAKSSWMIESVIYVLTGAIDAAKAVSILYAGSAFLLLLAFLFRVKSVPPRWAIWLALIAVANPVLVVQLSSFYVDGHLASLMVVLIVSVLSILLYRDERFLVPLAVSTVLLINVKFTGLAYAVIVLTLGFVALVVTRQLNLRYVAWGAASVVLAVVVFGYQPYVTNLLYESSIFYPAIRSDGSTVLEGHASAEFLERGRVEKLMVSVLSPSQSRPVDAMPSIKVPFSVTKQELWSFVNTTTVRIGGFGPWFGSTLLLLALATFGSVRSLSRNENLMTGLLGVMVLGSAMINPEAWLARLAPQIWLLAPILIGALLVSRRTWANLVGVLSMFLLTCNLFVIAAYNIPNEIQKTIDYRAAMEHLSRRSQNEILTIRFTEDNEAVDKMRLDYFGVSFRDVGDLGCSEPSLLGFPMARRMAICPRGRASPR